MTLMMDTRFDWVAARHDCGSDELFARLWREAAADVEAANELLGRGDADGVERPFGVEPVPPEDEEEKPPPGGSFTVTRERPDGSRDRVVFTRRRGVFQAAGFGHGFPLTAAFWLDHGDGRVKATIRYEEDGDELECFSEAPWQLLARALGPLFFAKARVLPRAAAAE